MKIENKIKFWSTITKKFIIKNIRRSATMIVVIMLVFVAMSIPRSTKFYDVKRYITDGDIHYYQLYGGDVLEYNNKQKTFIYNGDLLIKTKEIDDAANAILLFSFVLAAFLLISLLVEPVESYEIEEIIEKTIYEAVKEIFYEGEYIYTSYSKLIRKSQFQQDVNHLKYDQSIKAFMAREDFYTKSEQRNNKLKKLGI
jgi:hypothetical protein